MPLLSFGLMMTHMLCVTVAHHSTLTNPRLKWTLALANNCITHINSHLSLSFPLCLISVHLISIPTLLDAFCNLDIPIIDVELDGIFDEPRIAPFRNSVAVVESTNCKVESEEEFENTILWHHEIPPPRLTHALMLLLLLPLIPQQGDLSPSESTVLSDITMFHPFLSDTALLATSTATPPPSPALTRISPLTLAG